MKPTVFERWFTFLIIFYNLLLLAAALTAFNG